MPVSDCEIVEVVRVVPHVRKHEGSFVNRSCSPRTFSLSVPEPLILKGNERSVGGTSWPIWWRFMGNLLLVPQVAGQVVARFVLRQHQEFWLHVAVFPERICAQTVQVFCRTCCCCASASEFDRERCDPVTNALLAVQPHDAFVLIDRTVL